MVAQRLRVRLFHRLTAGGQGLGAQSRQLLAQPGVVVDHVVGDDELARLVLSRDFVAPACAGHMTAVLKADARRVVGRGVGVRRGRRRWCRRGRRRWRLCLAQAVGRVVRPHDVLRPAGDEAAAVSETKRGLRALGHRCSLVGTPSWPRGSGAMRAFYPPQRSVTQGYYPSPSRRAPAPDTRPWPGPGS